MKLFNFLKGNKKTKYHPIPQKTVREFNKIRAVDKWEYLCHAPFKSMTFFHTGDVLACWYNKLFPLGKYPDDSIQDIWFSIRADKLRNYILHNDLSYGCADCGKVLTEKNFYAVGAWRYDFLPDKTSEYPVSLDFQISNACNLQCIMCNGEYSTNVRTNRENRDLYKSPYDEKFFEQIKPFIPHLKEASFSGGEPFFANEFFKLWDLIINLNPQIKISVTTNGNIYNDKVLKYLNALPFNISLSLDAITAETYSKIRVNGDFDTVMKNMQIFSDYAKDKGTSFVIKICPMQQNWHEIPELSTYLNEKNISFQYNTVIYPSYCSLWGLSSDKLTEILAFFKNHSLANGNALQKQNASRYLDLISQIKGWLEEALQREQMGFYQLSVQQLYKKFIDNVESYFNNELNNMKDENPIQIEKIKDLFQQLIDDSPSDKIALLGMQYYASAPVERMLAEIKIRNYEKNRDRFIQIGS